MADLPPDEYDTYAPRIVDLIETGADDQAIAAYLRGLERETIERAWAVVFLSSQPHFGAPSQRPHTLPAPMSGICQSHEQGEIEGRAQQHGSSPL